jgi:CRISPR/Cas system-associated exonuclease Cas4 (RecB family)
MTPTAFSYSRLNSFETCPRKFHAVSITKNFKEPESMAMSYGKDVHKALELRVGKGVPLPGHLTHLEGIAGALSASPGDKITEYQMAVDASLKPVGWFHKDVYCRAVADLVLDCGTKAGLFDYKTGKKSNDFLQLRLTASLYFQHAPRVEVIKCAFIWTKDRSSSTVEIGRDEIGEVWSELSPRIRRFQEAFEQQDFPPRPSWQCRGCPVTTCQYVEARRQ